MLPSRTFPISLLLLAVLAGCDPSCEQVCDKLVACEDLGTERMSAAECEEQCNEQAELYATWNDTQLRASFTDELNCLYDSECSAIAEGVCYDEALWSY